MRSQEENQEKPIYIYPEASLTSCTSTPNQSIPLQTSIQSTTPESISPESSTPENKSSVVIRLFHQSLQKMLESNTMRTNYDIVITQFYLDATENIISSIFNITSSLKKGGLWINVGPLKYHGYHNTEFQPRLNWDEVILLCRSMPGITILHSDQIENVKYTQKNVSSTIDTETYTCCVLVAVVN